MSRLYRIANLLEVDRIKHFYLVLWIAILSKPKLKILTNDDFRKTCHVIFKKFFFLFFPFVAFLKVLKLPDMCATFQINKSIVVSFYSHPPSGITSSNCVGGIELIELTAFPDTLNYKSFFKHCILQTILHASFLFVFVWNQIFCSKSWAVFYILFDLVWSGIRCCSIKGSLFLVLCL